MSSVEGRHRGGLARVAEQQQHTELLRYRALRCQRHHVSHHVVLQHKVVREDDRLRFGAWGRTLSAFFSVNSRHCSTPSDCANALDRHGGTRLEARQSREPRAALSSDRRTRYHRYGLPATSFFARRNAAVVFPVFEGRVSTCTPRSPHVMLWRRAFSIDAMGTQESSGISLTSTAGVRRAFKTRSFCIQ